MKCEECGRQMFKNETQCPYCGYVYGPSRTTQFLLTLVGAALLFIGWLIWKG